MRKQINKNMETNKNNNETATPTIEVSVVVEPIKTHVLTFLMFAEYMGYMSEFIEDVDSWIDGKAPAESVQAFLNVEARDILAQMKKDYHLADIHSWWNEFYPLILFKADDAIKKFTKKEHVIVL